MLLNALVALRVRRLSRLDTDLPDAPPDDLVGVRALAEREAGGRAAAPVPAQRVGAGSTRAR